MPRPRDAGEAANDRWHIRNQRSRPVPQPLSISSKPQATWKSKKLPNTALLGVNRQIHREAASILYTENTFEFHAFGILQRFLSEWRSPSAACLGLNAVILPFDGLRHNCTLVHGLLHPGLGTLHIDLFNWFTIDIEFKPDVVFWNHTISYPKADIDVFSVQLRLQADGVATPGKIPEEELAEILAAKMSNSWTKVMGDYLYEYGYLNSLAVFANFRAEELRSFHTGGYIETIWRCIQPRLRQGVVGIVYDSDVNGWELSDDETSLRIKRAV